MAGREWFLLNIPVMLKVMFWIVKASDVWEALDLNLSWKAMKNMPPHFIKPPKIRISRYPAETETKNSWKVQQNVSEIVKFLTCM